jgi:hypothetical protein
MPRRAPVCARNPCATTQFGGRAGRAARREKAYDRGAGAGHGIALRALEKHTDGMQTTDTDDARILDPMRRWLERAVIGLNLCPFAKAVHAKGQLRWVVSAARSEEALLADLVAELEWLAAVPSDTIDTTLLVHPYVLQDFGDYARFLPRADAELAALGLSGTLQLASFHPRYVFRGAAPGDPANNSNRAPYPALHLLREASIDRAVAAFPAPARIYEANAATLARLGQPGWDALLGEE